MKKMIAALAVLMISVAGFVMSAASATPGDDHKESVCHPVNGNGELGNGWNLIPPDKASSHIDDNGNSKHVSKDGRVDVYAVDGECPVVIPDPEPTDDPTPEPPVITEPPVTPPVVTLGPAPKKKPKEKVVIPTVVNAGL